MNRRITGLVAAVVLALVGTVLLVGYVNSAEARALSGEELVDVLVVIDEIEAGTKAADLADKVETEQVPAKVRAEGAISDLDDVAGKVVTVDLVPGEQLVAERFAETASATRTGVPSGLLEVTVRLDPERAVGGQIRAGDTVAVLSSFEPFDLQGTDLGGTGATKTPNTTHVILHKVLVTNVQVSQGDGDVDTEGDADDERLASAPDGSLLVTLAVDAESAQRVVFTAEHGRLWLSLEPADAPETDLIIETRGTVER